MRRRKVKVGMRLRHKKTGRDLGTVRSSGVSIVKLDHPEQGTLIAAYGEVEELPEG